MHTIGYVYMYVVQVVGLPPLNLMKLASISCGYFKAFGAHIIASTLYADLV